MAGLVRVSFRTVNRKFSSALYITGDKAQTNFVVLTPHIDFEDQIKDKSDLIKNIEARKLNINLEKIEKRWDFFKMIDDHKTVLEVTRTEIYKIIKQLKEEGADKNKGDIEKLELHVKLVKDDLRNVREFSYGLEESANLAVLGLPNVLHPKTPLRNESVYHQFLDKPNATDKSHMEIGESLNLVEFTDPTFYFLKSDASLFEFALTNYFQTKMLELGLIQFSNADFARSVVVEGCGTGYLDNSKIFTLEGSNSDINRLHVVGGGTLYAFMAYFSKHVVQPALLPLKYFSIGRKYIPVDGSNKFNLFNLSQNTVGQAFVATEDDTQKMDAALDVLLKQIVELYEPLGYHFKLVYVPASELEIGESLKVSIQMFSNYSQEYVEVGNVSVYDNYLSKRLLFTYQANKQTKFVKVIAGEVLNVQKILGCVLENNFPDKKPLMSNLLQKQL
jgi:seryl-tRNA synthetase